MDGHRNTPIPPELARKRRNKLLVTGAGLGGLMLLSFLIALAASSGGRPSKKLGALPHDAGQTVVAEREDAALVAAPVPGDAASPQAIPTVPADAATGEAYLEVRTIPDGGTVKVGGQSRQAVVQPGDASGAAIAQLVLQAGPQDVIVELAGYQPEKRQILLEAGEHQRVEIAFTKKLSTKVEHGAPIGKLTVRTTPWSDVYLGGKKLGQAPFADLEVAAGTHTLTFKNPSRPTVTKTVKILPGKSTKLNFNL